jgi:2-C-methyl-D-erythritol 4-phosphate cytidylyltransferase
LGGTVPKALVELGGVPLFVQSLRTFLEFNECVEVIIAAPHKRLDEFQRIVNAVADDRVNVIAGGASRQESVGKALDAVTRDVDLILVHDAARPFVTPELIGNVKKAVTGNIAAALPGLPVADTLKRVEGMSRIVNETLRRDNLFSVQTPQAIRTNVFRDAHKKARADNFSATDDVALVEKYNLGDVVITAGDPNNFKITTAEDLERARERFSPQEHH